MRQRYLAGLLPGGRFWAADSSRLRGVALGGGGGGGGGEEADGDGGGVVAGSEVLLCLRRVHDRLYSPHPDPGRDGGGGGIQ